MCSAASAFGGDPLSDSSGRLENSRAKWGGRECPGNCPGEARNQAFLPEGCEPRQALRIQGWCWGVRMRALE